MWQEITENLHRDQAAPSLDAHPLTSAGVAAVGVCETQPIAVAGIRALLSDSSGLELAWASDSIAIALQLARTSPPAVLVLDKSFGHSAVVDALAEMRTAAIPTCAVVWGNTMSESEALRFLQAGARGILRKTSDLSALVSCIRRVAAGSNWMEEYVVREDGYNGHMGRSALTPREQQVLSLVEQGLRNKEIAQTLDIRPGTVKIHLKHIFEKTGVHGRYGLALATLSHKRPA